MSKMAGDGGNNKRFQYCTDPSGQEIIYLWALQGHSWRNPIDPTLQENVLIPINFFEYIYRTVCAVSLHSITNSGLIAGRQNSSRDRQTVFFTAVNPTHKNHKDPKELDLTKPRLASYKKKWKVHQDIVYWVDIQLAQRKGLKFYQTRSNAVILYDTLPAKSMRTKDTLGHNVVCAQGESVREKLSCEKSVYTFRNFNQFSASGPTISFVEIPFRQVKRYRSIFTPFCKRYRFHRNPFSFSCLGIHTENRTHIHQAHFSVIWAFTAAANTATAVRGLRYFWMLPSPLWLYLLFDDFSFSKLRFASGGGSSGVAQAVAQAATPNSCCCCFSLGSCFEHPMLVAREAMSLAWRLHHARSLTNWAERLQARSSRMRPTMEIASMRERNCSEWSIVCLWSVFALTHPGQLFVWPNCSKSVLRSDPRRTCRDSGPNEGRETAIFFQCQFAATCFVQLLPVHRSPGGNRLIVRDKDTLFSVPELKEAASSDVSNHSSSPSEDEGSRLPLTIHPSISLSTHHLCVLCRTFANEHARPRCVFSSKGSWKSVRNSNVDHFVVLLDFQILFQDLIQSRRSWMKTTIDSIVLAWTTHLHPKVWEMGFVLIHHFAVEHLRVNIHREPKVLCVLVRSSESWERQVRERICACGQCQVEQGMRHDTWMTMVLRHKDVQSWIFQLLSHACSGDEMWSWCASLYVLYLWVCCSHPRRLAGGFSPGNRNYSRLRKTFPQSGLGECWESQLLVFHWVWSQCDDDDDAVCRFPRDSS